MIQDRNCVEMIPLGLRQKFRILSMDSLYFEKLLLSLWYASVSLFPLIFIAAIYSHVKKSNWHLPFVWFAATSLGLLIFDAMLVYSLFTKFIDGFGVLLFVLLMMGAFAGTATFTWLFKPDHISLPSCLVSLVGAIAMSFLLAQLYMYLEL